MKFAVQALGATYEETLEWARWAESARVEAFGIPDHYLRGSDRSRPALDALAVMSGLARDTTSIELVMLVSPVTWRHPAVLAKTYDTIDQMSGGRFTMGVGTGWMEDEHSLFGFPFPETGKRFEMLEEALRYLRATHADPPEPFEGEHYRFEAFDMQPRPPLRLLVGGTGAVKTPRLAGAYADELNAYPSAEGSFALKVRRAREAAEEAGRDPDALLISSSGVMVAGKDDAAYRTKLERLAERMGTEVERLEQGMERRNSPRGTWEQVREILGRLEESGMERFYIQAFGDSTDDVAEAIQHLTAPTR
jgi:alkanesulfonate monooxygenase SsuD/methylene tetrahydromethanopterin reductase-like flavin-dependent oxidoreductase (luciferase family)